MLLQELVKTVKTKLPRQQTSLTPSTALSRHKPSRRTRSHRRSRRRNPFARLEKCTRHVKRFAVQLVADSAYDSKLLPVPLSTFKANSSCLPGHATKGQSLPLEAHVALDIAHLPMWASRKEHTRAGCTPTQDEAACPASNCLPRLASRCIW